VGKDSIRNPLPEVDKLRFLYEKLVATAPSAIRQNHPTPATFMSGLTNLLETESYFLGTDYGQGLPVWYTFMKIHIYETKVLIHFL